MKNKQKIARIVIMGLLTAILVVMSFTPLGYLNIGPLSITLNIIPVAIAAMTMGPAGGAAAGAVFGLTSFLQCVGIGLPSPFGVALFGISPLFTIITCFVPRILDGFLLGFLNRFVSKVSNSIVSSFVTGFAAALLNTLFFMTALMVLFGNTSLIMDMRGEMNVIAFMCAFVGVNAVFEILASTIVTGAVGTALLKARLIPDFNKTEA
ncbi:MAG: ECF transporter S component [Oscillospiraceae bacterium]